jgi:hypothetical protein
MCDVCARVWRARVVAAVLAAEAMQRGTEGYRGEVSQEHSPRSATHCKNNQSRVLYYRMTVCIACISNRPLKLEHASKFVVDPPPL